MASILVAGHGVVDPETRERGKGDWKALAWVLERRFPAEFGPTQRIDATVHAPTEPADLPDPELPPTPEEFTARFRDALREQLGLGATATQENA